MLVETKANYVGGWIFEQVELVNPGILVGENDEPALGIDLVGPTSKKP